jgi:hypothetical protein
MFEPNFWDIVVVENRYMWVCVKCRKSDSEIYVRSWNDIKRYNNTDIERYIYDKELEWDDLIYNKW